jgi:SAM-dependent methyltransferase
VLVVSDGRPAEAGAPPKTDAVYPAILKTTQRFLRLLPRDPCEDFLELCSGTGIAALIAASRFAKRAWAVDITERSTSFARFNAALNGLATVTALRGDAYDVLGDQTFDRIVAHPPYVPAFQTEFVFRDGGEDGEHVTRRLIEGIPRHLRPGGQFCCDCLMTDRTGARVEQRVRAMLGVDHEEFDVVVAEALTMTPTFYYSDLARQGKETFEGVGRWHESFARLKVEQMVFGAIFVQRRAERRPVVTVRRRLSSLTTGADFQWFLSWRSVMAQWDETQRRALLDARPRLAPQTELRSRARVRNGDWAMHDCTLLTTQPFATEADSPTWYARFLPWCDGEVTGREHLERLKSLGEVPAEASEDDFASMLGQLVDCGFLELDEFPLPRRATVP